ncbi:sugar nucleotide-binding protein [uncultured Senegalimassilia sp.]|uniref:sugar nucleotide-binding protein n=1 Tax=uncultured Senegalimassilia sp. TaxID=1714350 RepID=UPI0027DD716B|nr:sugar nucleotide-binding protein [uncultured Senegalimassilia sp.]
MAEFEFEKPLRAETTNIPGMLVFDLPVHGDSRGWFKENWQRAKQLELGLPDLGPVQNNVSFNAERGVTRGIHAEPWDKYISVATGSVFGAWVDLRPGKSFGQVYTCVIDPSKAIYVPRGVGNSFQALEDGTAYTYLVNAHWSAELKKTYTFVNLADPELGIDWPIPLDQCELSEADKHHPMLKDAIPMAPRRTLVTGANGQLGRAVRKLAEERGLLDSFYFTDLVQFDMSKPEEYRKYDWDLYGAVINCGAYTAVDKAETPEGRVTCWAANAAGPALLARTCAEHGITLVHISSDYVFDGTRELHDELEAFSPISVYGQSKAAGDLAVGGCPKHYILRSSWVIGDGKNFVKTMCALSDRVAAKELDRVTVVDDQLGRLTFTDQMAEAVFHLLDANAPYGTYGMTGTGAVRSWADIARTCFEAANGNGDKVVPVSTAEYYASAQGPIAPRPRHSVLDLAKLQAAGFRPRDWEDELADYLAELTSNAEA